MPTKIIVKKYIFKHKDSDHLNFKIVAELPDGHNRLVESILHDDNIVRCVAEYLHEFDTSLLGLCEPVKTPALEDISDEKICDE